MYTPNKSSLFILPIVIILAIVIGGIYAGIRNSNSNETQSNDREQHQEEPDDEDQDDSLSGSCYDSDGNDIYTYGHVTRLLEYEDGTHRFDDYDSCNDNGSAVYETYCERDQHPGSSSISSSTYTIDCDGLCIDGACMKMDQEDICSDTDGDDKYTKGIMTYTDTSGNQVEIEDTCESDTSLYEGRCIPNASGFSYAQRWSIRYCENGCSDGACIK